MGETIGSVGGVLDVVDDDADAGDDEFRLGNRTPSNDIPFTSSFTTNCGSPVEEFSVKKKV